MINLEKINKIKKSKPFKLADIIIYALAVVIVAVVLFAVFQNKGFSVEVRATTGAVVGVYDLTDTRQEIRIDDHLTVIIENGWVHVEDADCPDRVCVATGKIRFNGQSIVCLPNKIVITILGDGEAPIILGSVHWSFRKAVRL